jgi:hypothetical protein
VKVKTRHELRCECSSHQLLAYYGVEQSGRSYFHVRTRKQGRNLCNVVFHGDCELQCPACGIWVKIHVRPQGRLVRNTSPEAPAATSVERVVAGT